MSKQFEEKYNSMVSNFNEYMNKLDKFIEEQTEQYNNYFNEGENFFRIIFYVIREFLNDKTLDELFIKIPVNELASKKTDEAKNWARLQDVIHFALALATQDKLSTMVKAPQLESCNIGALCYLAQNSNESNHNQKFFQISQKKDFVYPSIRLSGRKTRTKYEEAVNLYKRYSNSIYKLSKLPSSTKNNNPLAKSKQKMLEALNLVQSIFQYPAFESQYNSAHIVGFNDGSKPEERLYSQDFFESPIGFSSKYEYNRGFEKEIICFIGDRKYNNVWDDALRALGQKKTNKVIYIGSEFDGFIEGDKRTVFEFSVREIYYHFANKRFPEISFNKIKFKWLEEKITEIRGILESVKTAQDNEKKFLIGYLLRHCMGSCVCNISESDISNLEEYLYNNFNLTEDEENTILKWYKSLRYSEPSPKTLYYNNIRATGEKHIVAPYSYINKYRAFIKKNKNSSNHVVVFDVYYDSNSQIEVIKDIVKCLCLARMEFMTYVTPSKIQQYFLNEPYLCNSNIRQRLFNKLSIEKVNINTTNTIATREIADYFTPGIIDEFIDLNQSRDINQSRYEIVTSDGGTLEFPGGDALVGNSLIPLSDLLYYSGEYLPEEITYYTPPEDFDTFIRIVHNFSRDKDVAYYSRLWKERLHKYCQEHYDGDFQKMRRELFPFLSKGQMKKYVDTDSQIFFPQKFRSLVNVMFKGLKLINKEECDNLLRAHVADRERTKHGKILKKSLLEYKRSGKKGDYLVEFDKKASNRGETMRSELLIEECLKTYRTESLKKIR